MSVYSKVEIPFMIIILSSILLFNSCEKLDLFNKEKENDSIALKYVDINPDTNWIDLENDYDVDIILLDTTGLWYMGEPENIYTEVQYAISWDTLISISFGKENKSGQIFLLAKDSAINESLTWTNHYMIGGNTRLWTQVYSTKYIGIRKIENSDTLYGWAHRSSFNFSEFAIDTTQQDGRIVYAGHFNK